MTRQEILLKNQYRRKSLKDLPSVMDSWQVATVLDLPQQTVSRMCAAGKIKAAKIGKNWRISRDTLIQMLEGNNNACNNL